MLHFLGKCYINKDQLLWKTNKKIHLLHKEQTTENTEKHNRANPQEHTGEKKKTKKTPNILAQELEGPSLKYIC